MTKRVKEILTDLEVTEEEATLLEEVEIYYQKKCNKQCNINMTLWITSGMRRVYIKCDWRNNNQNGKGNYFDLDTKWLSDRELGRSFKEQN